MICAIYARVSTDKQSTDIQLADLRKMCESRGLTLFREYIDVGISGSKQSRPALDQLMRDARRGLFNTVLVWRFDRFARSLHHLLTALQEFEAIGVSFISYSETFDTSTPMGKAMFAVIGAMAQLERDIIRERVTAGVRRYIEKHGRWGQEPQAIDLDRVRGLTLREAGKVLGVSYETVRRARESECRGSSAQLPTRDDLTDTSASANPSLTA